MTTPRYVEKVKPFTCDFIIRHTDTAENADRIIQSLDECYEEGVKAERERCKRCYEANTRHNPHSLSEPYSPNYKNANTATTHISYLDYADFVPKHVSPPTSHS